MAPAFSTYTASQFGSQLLGLLLHMMKTVIAPVRNANTRPAYVGAIEGVTLQLWPRAAHLAEGNSARRSRKTALTAAGLELGISWLPLRWSISFELGVESLLQT